MTAQVIYQGPTPPAGEKWCTVCAFTWKGAVNERHQEEIDAAGAAPEGTIIIIDGTMDEGLPPLEVVVASGFFGPLMQAGPLELCWSHLNVIKFQTASGLHLPVPGAGMPPGMNGFGG